jgi:hypothetical protein
MNHPWQIAVLGLTAAMAAAAAEADSTHAYRRAADLNPPLLVLEADHPNAAPFVGDFDKDGRLDLLVGEFQRWPGAGGEVYAYRNSGSNRKPRFEQGQLLKADGLPLTVPEGCYSGFGPQLADLDGDGHPELMSGAPMARIHIFKGLGGSRFSRASILEFPDDKTQRCYFEYNIRPHFCDWDGDGDFDLLVGSRWKLWLIRNTGDAKTFKFEKAEELKIGGVFSTRPMVVPYLADWDGDGRADVILGSNDGSVWWCRNLAPQGEPVLGQPQLLVPPGRSDARRSGQEPSAPGILARICVADFNGDGRADLVLGDATYISGTRGDLSAEEQARATKARETFNALAAEFRRLQTAPAGETEAAGLAREAALSARRKECAKAYAEWERSTAQAFSRHGAVWLFTRKTNH